MALIHIGGKSYELMHENRNGWNPEAFRNRYSEVLERYDYIIGDWGYNQLRLKGFFRDGHQKAAKESSFSGVSDYINEYCNFGCAYFVLEKKQGGNHEPDADDLDLNVDPEAPRLAGYDLRAAVESAAASSTSEADQSHEMDRQVPARKDQHGGARHRSHNGHNNHHGHGGKGQLSSRGGQGQEKDSSTEPGENKRRDRDQSFRKNNRNRPNDHRGKKPVKVAGSESAVISEGQNHKPQQP
jgi:uncharacterized protein YutD